MWNQPAAASVCSTQSWIVSMSGTPPVYRWARTRPTASASTFASAAPNSPVAAPARAIADAILPSSKGRRWPSRLTTSQGSAGMSAGDGESIAGAAWETDMGSSCGGRRLEGEPAATCCGLGEPMRKPLRYATILGGDFGIVDADQENRGARCGYLRFPGSGTGASGESQAVAQAGQSAARMPSHVPTSPVAPRR